ncbi:Polyhomeotic-like protein 1 [Galemys pyrenaicus]|uniref:Polyhomeotic-like protein 1 n=1 Tax=Galemys pyrenaicus TaxID=202257 RepID=A0A8J6DUW0_GALPY|nr:Polyhomeotic-like protein 1 [Galemys pyrenaicus]
MAPGRWAPRSGRRGLRPPALGRTAAMETESEQGASPGGGSAGPGGGSRPQIAQMSLYERQAVQALQALQRQPNAAQYFHQFMLQQQLSNAQLHSLAAVQQATIAASRQASSPNASAPPQQAATTQASINLATTSAAQLISRSQSVSSPSATTLAQPVLLGSSASPPLSQPQAQMYLRVSPGDGCGSAGTGAGQPLGRGRVRAARAGLSAKLAGRGGRAGCCGPAQPVLASPASAVPPPPPHQPQLGNLLQVNRTLGRSVPLASQLILMPNGAVAAVQQEVPPAPSPGVHADTDQAQNLAVRGQQASAPGPQMPGSAPKAAPPGAAPASSLSPAASQALAAAPASSGASGQSLNLSHAGGGSGSGAPGSVGAGAGGQAAGGLGLPPPSGTGGSGSCPRKGTGVVQPLPAAHAVTASQGSQMAAEGAAAKKTEADGPGQQGAGVNLTRTAAPAPSQTLISSGAPRRGRACGRRARPAVLAGRPQSGTGRGRPAAAPGPLRPEPRSAPGSVPRSRRRQHGAGAAGSGVGWPWVAAVPSRPAARPVTRALPGARTATYTQIQPHSLIQQQQQIHLQQKQVVIQQQIAIHHQQQFQHRQSQLLHTATHLQLAQPPALGAPPPQGPAAPPAPPQGQALVVQPMLQSSPLPLPPDPGPKAPVPIQSKPPGPPIRPPQLGATKMSAAPPAPHIPVQVVGARQPGTAQAQALGLAQLAAAVPASRAVPGTLQPGQARLAASPPPSQAPGAPQEAPPSLAAAVSLAPAQGPALKSGAAASPVVAQVPAAFCLQPAHLPGKAQPGAVKRKAECEDDRDDGPALPGRASPATDSLKALEDKSGLGEKTEPAAGGNAGAPGAELGALGPAPVAPPPTLALLSRPSGDSRPPQAIVKPQILTHIIEGFVIQEGAEPFPVGCSPSPKEAEKPVQTGLPPGLGEKQPGGPLGAASPGAVRGEQAGLLQCEYCGKSAPAEQFRGSKRFCSMTCAKRYNVSCSHQFRLKRKKMKELQEAGYARVRRRGPRRSSSDIARAKIQGKRHRGQEDSSRGSDNSSCDEALSPTSPGPLSGRAGLGERDLGSTGAAPPTPEGHGINPVFLSGTPSRWSVEEVYEFIASLQGCREIAEEFRSQEIDGQALLLLKEEHLMSAMNIKLGPALKICAKINVLKEP